MAIVVQKEVMGKMENLAYVAYQDVQVKMELGGTQVHMEVMAVKVTKDPGVPQGPQVAI